MSRRGSSTSTHAAAPASVVQNTTARYLPRKKLERLLKEKFQGIPIQDFCIEMKDDQWCFKAPERVPDEDLDDARD